MGDHRADIKLEMTLHGKTYTAQMNINYWEHNGCDDRIIDWFSECWDDAHARYTSQCAEAHAAEKAREQERCDRLELARLLKKFGLENR